MCGVSTRCKSKWRVAARATGAARQTRHVRVNSGRAQLKHRYVLARRCAAQRSNPARAARLLRGSRRGLRPLLSCCRSAAAARLLLPRSSLGLQLRQPRFKAARLCVFPRVSAQRDGSHRRSCCAAFHGVTAAAPRRAPRATRLLQQLRLRRLQVGAQDVRAVRGRARKAHGKAADPCTPQHGAWSARALWPIFEGECTARLRLPTVHICSFLRSEWRPPAGRGWTPMLLLG